MSDWDLGLVLMCAGRGTCRSKYGTMNCAAAIGRKEVDRGEKKKLWK